MTSSLSIPKQAGLSSRDPVIVSAQSSHPAYTVDNENLGEGQTETNEMENTCNSPCSKQITVVVICSENGSVTLSNLDVSYSENFMLFCRKNPVEAEKTIYVLAIRKSWTPLRQSISK